MPTPPLPPAARALLAAQDGVVSRRQAESAGLSPGDLERLVRRREWVRVEPGIFLDHTGRPTWRQRAWIAVLACWPAALRGESAMRATDRRTDDDDRIRVAIDRHRALTRVPVGVEVRRTARLDEVVQWNTSPPRQRYEEAVIDAAADAPDDLAAVAVLTGACAERRTTPDRLLATVASRSRVPRRRWVVGVLTDARDGTCSVLEHGYLARVERAHGLPRGRRQVRVVTGAGVVYRDVGYEGGVVVELDGLAFHGGAAQRDADLRRDLLLVAEGGTTARGGYRQVFGDECETAVAIATILRSRGVRVVLTACGSGCPAARLAA